MTLQCAVCQTCREAELAGQQLANLKNLGAVLVMCAKCGRATYWICFGADRCVFLETHVEPPPAQEAAPRENARGPRRLDLELPVRIRSKNFGGSTEFTVTNNVSRGGLYFVSDRLYKIGQEVQVALNYSADATGHALEQRAVIARIVPIKGSLRKGIGVKYL